MAIQKQETTELGQVAKYHRIIKCEFDAKYQQMHVVVGSYTDKKYRDEEKSEEEEKGKQLAELKAFREKLATRIQEIEKKLPGLQEQSSKLYDKIDDIMQEPNMLRSEEIENEKQERQNLLNKELEEITTLINELYKEHESILIQDAQAMENIQAWSARVPTARCMYLTTYTLSQGESEVINKILDLLYPELMKLEPFKGSKGI